MKKKVGQHAKWPTHKYLHYAQGETHNKETLNEQT